MSREIKRVDKKFQWPLNEDWLGYINPFQIDCPVCEGDSLEGECDYGVYDEETGWCVHPAFATACKEWQPIEPTSGDGWQMWQTVSEPSPVSPIFDTVDELINWMADNKYSQWAIQWVRKGKTWLPTAMGCNNTLSFVQDHSAELAESEGE
jgi:hypothetical protein